MSAVSLSEYSEKNRLYIDSVNASAVSISYSNDVTLSTGQNESSNVLSGNIYIVTGLTSSSWIKVTYDNIGTYDGEEIKATVLFSGFTNVTYIEISSEAFYKGWRLHSSPGLSYCTINLSLNYMDGSDVSTIEDYYVGFNSLNGNNDYHEWVYHSTANALISEDSNVKEYTYKIYDTACIVYGGSSNDFTDYVGGSTFYKNSVLLGVYSASNDFIIGKDQNASNTTWMAFSSAMLTAAEPNTPVKTVNGEEDIWDISAGDNVIYKIAQSVHTLGVDILNKYSSFIIFDTLPDEITYDGSNPAYLTDADGNVISNAGTVSFDSSTNTVKFTFSSSYLSSTMAMNGETYILVIPCTVNSTAKPGTTFENTATVNFDNYPTVTSNEVTVTMLGYKITTSVTDGTITESEENIDLGDSRTIYYSPNSGYQIDSVVVDGVELDITKYPGSYTFSNISDDHTINVTFIPYWKITTSVTNGTISDDITEGITGEDYTIEHSPDKGYLIDTVVVDGEEVDVTKYPSSYTFEDLDADHTITVTYAEPEVSKEIYLSSSEFSSNYTSGQSIEGYVLVPGDVVEYRISYSNPTSVERTIVITDTLPSEVKPTSATNNGTISGQKVTWTITASAYSSEDVSVYAEVVDSGEFTNTASVTFKKLTGSTTESDVTIKDIVLASAIDDPVKQIVNENGNDVSGQIISAGDKLTYYIQFTNPSSNTKAFTITDIVPSGTTLVNDSISDSGTYNDGTITWTKSLAAGVTYTVSFSVTADGADISEVTPTFSTSNTANVAVDKITVETNTVEVDVANPYIETSVTGGTIAPSSNVSYGSDKTVEYSPNTGYILSTVTVDGKDVDITKYPDSYTFSDITDDHTITVTYVKPEISKDVYIYSGASTSSYSSGQNVEGNILAVGDVIEYRISYENPTSAARTIVITDTMPSGLTITKVSNDGTISGQTVTWTLSVSANTSGYVSIYAKVGEDAGTLTNNAKVTFKTLPGSASENDVTVTDKVTVYGSEDPVKWVENEDRDDVSNQVVLPGDTLTYCISFTNTASTTKTFTITDEIPDGVTLVDGSISDKGTESNGTITWTLSLTAGMTYSVSFSVTVDGTEISRIPNQATVYVDNIEMDTVATSSPDGDDKTWVYVLGDPVKIAMDSDGNNLSDYQTIVNAGSAVVYEITVENPSSEESVFTITDQLPEYVTYVNSDNGGVYDSSTHTVTWKVSDAGGASTTVSVTVMVSYGSQGACFYNTANVSVDGVVTSTCSASIAVMTDPAKYVTSNGNDANNEPVTAGDTLTYSINFYNPSEYMKTFYITDYLPDEVAYVSSDETGTYDEATHSVSWKVTLLGKTYTTVNTNVTVNAGAEGTAFDNVAYVSVDEASLQTNKVTTWVGKKTVTSVDGSDLSGKTVAAGDMVVYTIYTINSTSEDRYMQIYDNIPAGLTPISVSDGGTINGQEVTWNVLVGAGYLKTVTVTCTVNKGYSGKQIINTATVKGVYLTANVSDPGIYTGETISTGISATASTYGPFVAGIAIIAAVGVGTILIVKRRRRR